MPFQLETTIRFRFDTLYAWFLLALNYRFTDGKSVLQRFIRSPYRGYIAAFLGAVLVLAVDDVMDQGRLRTLVASVTFVFAVLAAAVTGGWKPGLLCTLLSVVGYYFVAINGARWPLNHADVLALLPYMIVGTVISFLSEALIRASVRIADRQTRLQEEIAERKRAEQHSQERAERLRVTLASIGDAVITTDVQGKITTMNPVAESLTGWGESQAVGRPMDEVFQIINERTRTAVENPCGKVLRTGSMVDLSNHTVLIARDGREIPIDDSAAPIKDRSSEVIGVVLVFRDATKERVAREALQRLASIVENSEDAIIGKSIDGLITSWNAAAEKLYGYSAEEVIGKDIRIIVPAENRDELSELMKRLAAGETIEPLDTIRQRKDGSLVHVSLQISPIRDVHGDVVGVSKIDRDISERKTTEEALAMLARTSNVLAALTDRDSALQRAVSTMVPFFADFCVAHTLDDDGNMREPVLCHRNPDKERLLKELLLCGPIDWNPHATTGNSNRIRQTEYLADVPDRLLASIARNARYLELIRTLNPRSVINVRLVIRDRVIGAICFVVSDSGRRYMPRDVGFAEDLARRVATAIDNSELLESVRAADRQKDEFLAMLAHELRNPLAAISYANALIPASDADSQPELLDLVNRQVRNLSHLIDGLLDVSRISRDKIKLQKEHFDGVVVLRRAAEVLRPLVEEKGHEFKMDIQAGSVSLFADVTRVEQILTNVLNNAIKYTPDGGRIWVTAFNQEKHFVIKVKDSGIGIPPETLPRIFDLFAQAEQGLDRSQGGLGIGLTIARKLAEIQGGTVTAASEGVGKGAEFTIRLPLSDGHLSHAEANNKRPSKANSKLRILVVDDNRDTVYVQSLFLSGLGHEVEAAYDGPTAVATAQTFRPQAILTDLGLPGMNGYEVAKTLRAQGFVNETLIAISGYGRPEDERRCREAGFNHHFVKPVDQHALTELLNRIERAEQKASG
jgi:PAS domain S-box-containing protein